MIEPLGVKKTGKGGKHFVVLALNSMYIFKLLKILRIMMILLY